MPYIRQYTELTPQELRQLGYKRRYKEENPSWDDSMIKLTDLVRERCTKESIVLDFGCGRGNFVIDELAESFSQKIGFDVSAESIQGNITCDKVILGNSTSLPFPDASMDVVVSLWVFEHIEKPEEVMKEIFRVLKPNGFFAFVTPNKKSALITLRRMMSDGIAHRLLKFLYGREEKDAFSVYYRANTIKDITSLAKKTSFSQEIVLENADPSYTSFNEITYTASKIFIRLFGPFAKPHIISVLRKDQGYLSKEKMSSIAQ